MTGFRYAVGGLGSRLYVVQCRIRAGRGDQAGEQPESIESLEMLQQLEMDETSPSGDFPEALGRCTALERDAHLACNAERKCLPMPRSAPPCSYGEFA
jgi:hypothetical protein